MWRRVRPPWSSPDGVDMTDGGLPILGPVTGRSGDGSVTVTLTGLSYRDTNRGRRYPYGEFGQDFIGKLHAALPAPRRSGLLRLGRGCASCGSSLGGVPIEPVSLSVDVVLKRIPPIHVDAEIPASPARPATTPRRCTPTETSRRISATP